ncbi:type VI secretion system lipoprotein TssJ [Paraburkholderia sp. DHOC27]|uniref:type VI secretion system lipoprotein TssJ n=1 Tax=Paraburkholderia sp. DHOC27 TaxID=2303330 RepID=UPI000E3BB840|nr:type VI secretion system lipoprotein TssJ [Paraburkholderia sp. DHOC27]RFU45003.1 type VI secretion system lipoprotein TssJ [Paraburkholderia sp. DHOC27]
MLIRFVTMPMLLLAVTLLLDGCGAWQSVSDATTSAYQAVFYKQVKVLKVDLSARAELNPDEAMRSTSVAVRIYQLTDRQRFEKASYDDLLKNDKAVLAQDLRGSIGTVVSPGASASVTQPMQPDTEYIGVAAFYRDLNANGAWRRSISRKDLSADTPLKLELVDREIVMTSEASGSRQE